MLCAKRVAIASRGRLTGCQVLDRTLGLHRFRAGGWQWAWSGTNSRMKKVPKFSAQQQATMPIAVLAAVGTIQRLCSELIRSCLVFLPGMLSEQAIVDETIPGNEPH